MAIEQTAVSYYGIGYVEHNRQDFTWRLWTDADHRQRL